MDKTTAAHWGLVDSKDYMIHSYSRVTGLGLKAEVD